MAKTSRTCVPDCPGMLAVSMFRSIIILFLYILVNPCHSIRFLGERETYARYPRWDACISASIAFEFRTTQKDGLLMYTDDNGKYDYLQVAISDGAIRLWINFVVEEQQRVEIELGHNLNDGQWHRVEVKRNRMETRLLVDKTQSSKVTFGSDFRFGEELASNNYMYFGGVPSNYVQNLARLDVPASVLNTPFKGEMRNILYFNCSCIPVRASVIDGRGYDAGYTEACELRDPCPSDCPCFSSNDGPACECSYKQECMKDLLAHYQLPMDRLDRDLIVNPSGLDSRVYGGPELVHGVHNNALKLDGRSQWIHVSGPSHKGECFGDLERCLKGYYVGMWTQFQQADGHKSVYMSNGGHLINGHGIAMSYSSAGLEFVFKTKGGKEWKVNHRDVQPGKWYHVAASWAADKGLYLYINGHLVAHEQTARPTTPTRDDGPYRDFVIGRSNDHSGTHQLGTVMVDDFLFMSEYKSEEDIRELGPTFKCDLPMDYIRGTSLEATGCIANIHGQVQTYPGRVGQAIIFSDYEGYVDLGDASGKCLGDLDKCKHGFYISFYVKFNRLDNKNSFIFSSPHGMEIYQIGSQLVALAQKDRSVWEARYNGLDPGTWYFVEVSWSPSDGISLYVDGLQVDRQSRESSLRDRRSTSEKRVFIGRSNIDGRSEKLSNAMIDEMDIFYATRDELSRIGTISTDQVITRRIIFNGFRNNILRITDREIRGYGDLELGIGKGQDMRAIYLLGRAGYLDLGANFTCGGNLELCRQGVTLRLGIRPTTLQDNVVYWDSFPVRLFYRDGQLYGQFQTATQLWTVRTPHFRPEQWQRVELSWHPVHGLTMYIDGQRVDHQGNPAQQPYRTTTDWRTFFGRSLQEGQPYAHVAVDNIEYWTTHGGGVPDDEYIKIVVVTPRPVTPRPTYRPPTWTEIGRITTQYPYYTERPRYTQEPPDNGRIKIIQFNGQSFVQFNFNRLPPEYLRPADIEEFQFNFLANEPNGLIWLHEDQNRKMYLALKDGQLIFVNDDGTRTPDEIVIGKRDGVRFDDRRWHSFRISRRGRRINLSVDQRHHEDYIFARDVQFLVPAEVYLGGTQNTYHSTKGKIHQNFNGGLAQVVYTTETRDGNKSFRNEVNLIAQIGENKEEYPGVIIDNIDWPPEIHHTVPTVWTRRTTPAPPVTHPPPPRVTAITFREDRVYLTVPESQFRLQTGSTLTFKFQTVKREALLMYATSNMYGKNFIALEIYDGRLYLIHNFGGHTKRTLFSEVDVSDGRPHEVELRFLERQMVLSLDRETERVAIEGNEQIPRNLGPLYIGGFTSFETLPWHTWARTGYQGCIEDLRINGQIIDLHRHVLSPQQLGGIEYHCASMPQQCSAQSPCVRGKCTNKWGGYYCDCSATNYTGDRCHIPSLTGAFNGNIHVKTTFYPQQKYHADDISFRFRTFIGDGLFFQTKAGTDSGFLRGELEGGRVKVTTNLGGDQKVFYAGENLNDYQWHTVYIQRRGNHLILWVDDLDKQKYILPGQDYHLYVSDLFVGGYRREELHLPSSIKNYIGYLQNFYIGGQDIFQQDNMNITGNFYHENYILPLEFRSVTFTNFNSFIQLQSFGSLSGLNIYFLFRTHDANGVILFSEGRNKELFVVELHDGKLHMKLDIPGKPPLHVTTPDNPRFNDGKWHLVSISHQKIGGQDQLNMAVDGLRSSHSFSGIDQLSLQGTLFVGGLPDATFQKQYVKDFLASKTGFRGCLASLTVNGNSPDLYKVGQGSGIIDTCQDIKSQCTKFVCSNGGICHDHQHNGTIWCDCSKTGYAGQYCKDEPVGYYFRKQGNADLYGMMAYRYHTLEMNDSSVDEIVFGVLTTEKNAVLTKIISGKFNEFIEIKLVNGYPVVMYDTDGFGASTTITSDVFVSDNKYHIIRFVRTKDNGTLYVDSRANINTHIVPHSTFDRVGRIFIGGVYQGGKIVDGSGFHGIIGGLNVNGHLIFPNAEQDVRVEKIQDIVVAPHPFIVYSINVTPSPITTQAPIVTLPPVHVLPILPHDIGGGGIGWAGGAGTGGTGISVWVFPDGGSGGSVVVPGPLGPVGGGEGAALAQVIPVSSMPATGPRAGAVMGTILGLAALASSLMWAFYRCKPGWCTCLKAPAAVPLNIVHRAGAGSGGGGAAAASGAGGSVKTTAVNGSQAQVAAVGAGGGGGSGGGGAYYYSQQSSSSGGGGGGLQTDSYDSATLRATGTFSNRGTAIGTPRTGRHQFASQSSTSGFDSSGGVIGASTGSGGGSALQSYQFEAGNTHADYDVASGVHSNYQSNTLTAGGGGGGGGGFSTSTMSSNYNYSVKTIQTVGGQQQMMGYISGSTSNVLMTPGAMGEEIRVDCCLMTRDGHSVVTGSSLGPPQVWNMSNGELLRIMQGETVGSTNLHLVCNDRLLVGAINADLEINQYSVPKGVHNYVFQIWDFASGRPLGMTDHETCSALTVMSDNDKVVFARSDKFGGGSNIVVWDLLGNQPVKEMRFDAPVGNNDYISHLSLSQNNRYIIAGFTNTFDNFAEFVVFDMTLTSYNITDPNILRLDAAPECTAILPRDEAVTGLRNGDLVVWSLRTGQPNRQLVANNGKHAHFREVKAVARSEDSKFLVSGSADGTLKVWDLESERHICTMSGHTDEVWCTAVSSDNEIVVSGSRDGTIRLWQLRTGKEICTFNAGVDVFYITMSRDKGTIVALGDKFGARKLIMLQVVRSKVKRQVLA